MDLGDQKKTTMIDDVIDNVIKELKVKSKQELYYDDPVLWAEEVLGAELYSKQKEMLRSLAQNKRTAVKSAHSTGKSYTMGIAACWWVATRGPNSLVVSTAPTYAQVNKILWEEIRKHYVEHNLPGKITQGDAVEAFVRPEVARLARNPTVLREAGLPTFEARITSLLFDGANSAVLLRELHSNTEFRIALPQTGEFADLTVGETVAFGFDPERAVCFAST